MIVLMNGELKGIVHIEAGFDNSAPWREIEWLEQTVDLATKNCCLYRFNFVLIAEFEHSTCQIKDISKRCRCPTYI